MSTSSRFLVRCTASILLAWIPVSSAVAGEAIHWRSGPAKGLTKSPGEVAEIIQAVADSPQIRHLVVQSREAIDPAARAAVESLGLILLDYLGNHAYFASVVPGSLDAPAVVQLALLSDARLIDTPWKLHPLLLSGEIPPWAVITTTIGSSSPNSSRIALS